jgi:hypothetical protein
MKVVVGVVGVMVMVMTTVMVMATVVLMVIVWCYGYCLYERACMSGCAGLVVLADG